MAFDIFPKIKNLIGKILLFSNNAKCNNNNNNRYNNTYSIFGAVTYNNTPAEKMEKKETFYLSDYEYDILKALAYGGKIACARNNMGKPFMIDIYGNEAAEKIKNISLETFSSLLKNGFIVEVEKDRYSISETAKAFILKKK